MLKKLQAGICLYVHVQVCYTCLEWNYFLCGQFLVRHLSIWLLSATLIVSWKKTTLSLLRATYQCQISTKCHYHIVLWLRYDFGHHCLSEALTGVSKQSAKDQDTPTNLLFNIPQQDIASLHTVGATSLRISNTEINCFVVKLSLTGTIDWPKSQLQEEYSQTLRPTVNFSVKCIPPCCTIHHFCTIADSTSRIKWSVFMIAPNGLL